MRKQLSFEQQKKWYGVLFLSPWMLGFLLLFAIPLIASFRFSLGKLEMLAAGGYKVMYGGFGNYKYALTEHAEFNRVLTESVVNMAVNVPLILFFSLFAATLLNQKFRGRAIARAVFFLPVILASGIIHDISTQSIMSTVMNGMTYGTNLDPEVTGLSGSGLSQSLELKGMLVDAGMSQALTDYLSNAVDRIYEIISSSGVQILIFLAGLQSISPSLYEASKIEGATGYEIFWKVTFPMVSPLILTNVIYTVIDSFADNSLTKLAYKTAFTDMNFGLSAAMSWMYFIVEGLMLLLIAYTVSKRVFYYD
ncbi:sugar ABC transporter permease [Paenibacillus rhizovicinus]|uniref:Sugar ABC transporter permease n=2 Tax=Paenibacillus rhizovicinus TaxID=2704463 RepID=A0A6C0P8V3_9BACL|nr:sugar ABC transporter permease [Paenibacillus rhizovicinus]